jgi:ribose transport system substrate-binding protein
MAFWGLRRTYRQNICMATIVVAVTLVAGCSSSSQSGTAPSSPGTPSSNGAKAAAAKVADAMKLPSFDGNPAFDMAALKGKTVTVLLSSSAVPFVANIGKGVQEAANIVGWSATIVDGKGSVTEWSRVVTQAVSQKVDAIITVGASPAAMKPAVALAKDAGIPVVDALTADQEKDPLVPGTFAHVSISFYDSGALQADYVIANGTPDAHILVFGDNEFPGEVTRVQGMKDEFTKLCPGCQVDVQDTQVAKLATDLSSTTQTLLRRDPKIAWVLPTYDAQALYIIPGIKSAGLANKVKVVGSDAVASNLSLVAKDDVQVADVGEPAGWSGWAAVDMMGRALSKGPVVSPKIPLRMFTAENLKGIDPNNEGALFGDSFRAGYKKLWGLGA